MDVVPNAELMAFLDSLDVQEETKVNHSEEVVVETDVNNSGAAKVEDSGERRNYVWHNIADAVNSWSCRILFAECLHTKSEDFRHAIETSLYRQQLDGFLSDHDAAELRYITYLWVQLLNSLSSYLVGCEFRKRKIITLLLELYSMKQISENLFIETCLKL